MKAPEKPEDIDARGATLSLKSEADHFVDWESNVFGYGYGSGEERTVPAVHTFLLTCPREGNYDYVELEAALGALPAWLLINTLCHADILEYGTSPRFGWLSERGKALRAFVARYSPVELARLTEYPDGYIHCYPDACNCGPGGYDPARVCPNPFWRGHVRKP